MSLPEDLREHAAARAAGVHRTPRPEHPDVILAREACHAAGLPSATAAGSASLIEAIVEHLRPEYGTGAADAVLDDLLADPARWISAYRPPAPRGAIRRWVWARYLADARVRGAVAAVHAAFTVTPRGDGLAVLTLGSAPATTADAAEAAIAYAREHKGYGPEAHRLALTAYSAALSAVPGLRRADVIERLQGRDRRARL